jgi:hypothetical protein
MTYQNLSVVAARIKGHTGALASLTLVAGAILTASGAQAADVPVAKIPVDYVRICSLYGPGYLYIPSIPGMPGAGTCLKIGGFMRSDSYTGNTTRGTDIGVINSGLGLTQNRQAKNQVAETLRMDINFDARTATDWGVLRSYIEFRGDFGTNANVGNFNSPAGSVTGVPTFTFDRAFIELAGFRFGREETNYNFLTNTNLFFQFEAFSEYWVNQAAYTYKFGDGYSATIAVEDPTTGGTQKSNATAGGLTVSRKSGASFVYGGLDIPDLIGNLRVSQAWGAAQLSVGYHQDYQSSSTALGNVLCTGNTPCSGNGYGVQAGVNFNVPALGAGSKLGIQAAYAVGAVGLAYSWGYQGLGTFASADLGADAAIANGALQQSRMWSVGSAFQYVITPTVEFDLTPSYYVYNNRNTAGELNFNGFELGTAIKWTPLGPQLAIYTDFEYRHINVSAATVAAGNAAFTKADAYIVDLRLKRNF